MSQVWLGKTGFIQKISAGVAAGITAVILLTSFVGPDVLLRLENASLDGRFVVRGLRASDPNIVLVAVDEQSLQEIGRWPWPRDTQARLVDAISADGARVIGLDVIYAEPESSDTRRIFEKVHHAAMAPDAASPALRELLGHTLIHLDTDRQLADSLRAAGNTILAIPFVVPETSSPISPANLTGSAAVTSVPEYVTRGAFVVVRHSSSGSALEPYIAVEQHAPLKAFAQEAIGLGHVYSLPDPDGITRYEYLVIRYGDEYYPSFPLEMTRAYLNVPRDRMAFMLGEGVQLGDRFIPTDQKARMLINYLGPERHFHYISAADVLQQRIYPGSFRDKIVIVGTAALGTYDQKATPFSANVPGIEKNATVIDNVLRGAFVQKPWWSRPLDLALILGFGLGLGYAMPKMRALPAALLSGGLGLTYAAAAHMVFVSYGLWLDMVAPIVTIVTIFICVTVLRFMLEEHQAKEVRALFSSYVSPQIVAELIKDPRKATVGGDRRELTMLFSDVVAFTSFSEKHAAEAVVAQLNEYLEAMTDVIFRWNGTLDKFVGDSIVVFWNAPVEQPDHVELAVKCALNMRKRLEELQCKWRAEGRTPFEHGIGINTGVAVVGNIGAQGKKMDYTMIGDYVNLTARVEGLTRHFSTGIVLTEYIAVRLKALIAAEERPDNRGCLGHVALHKLGAVKVKGKESVVVVYGLKSLQRHEHSTVNESSSEAIIDVSEK
jgi:adenylate cyclase